MKRKNQKKERLKEGNRTPKNITRDEARAEGDVLTELFNSFERMPRKSRQSGCRNRRNNRIF